MINNEEKINEFGHEIVELIDSYSNLPAYEIGNQLIMNAASLLLATAPNNLIAMKTIIACVQNGIADYEEFHKKDIKKEK